MKTYNYKKATQLANYIVTKLGGSADKTKIIKLLWAADRYHLRKYARLVSGDTYYALKKGPVASHTLDILNKEKDYTGEGWEDYADIYLSDPINGEAIKTVSPVDEQYLSETDKEALDFAISKLGNKSTADIVDFAHNYPEWKPFKDSFENGISSREDIDISKFFDNPENIQDDIFAMPEELLNISKELFTDIQPVIE